MTELRDPIPCTTEQFWRAMCRPNFVRTSRHTGQIGLGQFSCLAPPEDVPGFLEKKMLQTMRDLGASKYQIACAAAAFEGRPWPPRPWWHRLFFWRKA